MSPRYVCDGEYRDALLAGVNRGLWIGGVSGVALLLVLLAGVRTLG